MSGTSSPRTPSTGSCWATSVPALYGRTSSTIDSCPILEGRSARLSVPRSPLSVPFRNRAKRIMPMVPPNPNTVSRQTLDSIVVAVAKPTASVSRRGLWLITGCYESSSTARCRRSNCTAKHIPVSVRIQYPTSVARGSYYLGSVSTRMIASSGPRLKRLRHRCANTTPTAQNTIDASSANGRV
ncbi:MAG: hypothetical protein ACI84D_002750 [Thalassolituus oleivorans]|jgi:hypothetical protein